MRQLLDLLCSKTMFYVYVYDSEEVNTNKCREKVKLFSRTICFQSLIVCWQKLSKTKERSQVMDIYISRWDERWKTKLLKTMSLRFLISFLSTPDIMWYHCLGSLPSRSVLLLVLKHVHSNVTFDSFKMQSGSVATPAPAQYHGKCAKRIKFS